MAFFDIRTPFQKKLREISAVFEKSQKHAHERKIRELAELWEHFPEGFSEKSFSEVVENYFQSNPRQTCFPSEPPTKFNTTTGMVGNDEKGKCALIVSNVWNQLQQSDFDHCSYLKNEHRAYQEDTKGERAEKEKRNKQSLRPTKSFQRRK